MWKAAPNSKNSGSTLAGIWEVSSILTTKNPPRVPSTSAKNTLLQAEALRE
jgi:hypothetical protein